MHDIKFLCELIDDITHLDCVTFYNKINTFQQELNMNKIDMSQIYVNSLGRCSFKPTTSNWLLAEPSKIIFDESLRRVFRFMNNLMEMEVNKYTNFEWLQNLNPKWYIVLNLYTTICQSNFNDLFYMNF